MGFLLGWASWLLRAQSLLTEVVVLQVDGLGQNPDCALSLLCDWAERADAHRAVRMPSDSVNAEAA